MNSVPPYEEGALPTYTPLLALLPQYTLLLQFYGVALLKNEFSTPWSAATGTTKPVLLELNLNQLRIYELSGDKLVLALVEALFMHQNYDDGEAAPVARADDEYLFDRDAYGDDAPSQGPNVLTKLKRHLVSKKTEKRLALLAAHPEFADNGMLFEPTGSLREYEQFARSHRGRIMHLYTLQNLDVGEAPCVGVARYKEDAVLNRSALVRYRNTLRLRIEYRQLLLHFWLFHGMVHWYRNLCIGRDLALLLDLRNITRLKLLPRSYSAVNNALLDAMARESHRNTFDAEIKGHRPLVSLISELLAESVDGRLLLVLRCSSVSSTYSPDTVCINGVTIACRENHYTPVEKAYISNCIPNLNLFDKWVGLRITLSNFSHMLPKDDARNINKGDKIYISYTTFENLVRTYQKLFSTLYPLLKHHCKEYYVDDTGLVSLPPQVDCE